MTEIKDILEERGDRYGEFKAHAEVTYAIKRALYKLTPNVSLEEFHMEALDMIAHKLGRIVNGDPNYIDSWVDIVGYAQLVVNILEENQKK